MDDLRTTGTRHVRLRAASPKPKTRNETLNNQNLLPRLNTAQFQFFLEQQQRSSSTYNTGGIYDNLHVSLKKNGRIWFAPKLKTSPNIRPFCGCGIHSVLNERSQSRLLDFVLRGKFDCYLFFFSVTLFADCTSSCSPRS